MKLPPELANLPAWLKIVGVVLIVLGLIAFGVGGVRATGDPEHPSASPGQGGLSIFAAVPARDIKVDGACSTSVVNGRTEFTGTSCRFTVQPNELLPRELRLTLTVGSGTMLMAQKVKGEVRTAGPSSIPTAIAVPVPSSLAVPVAGSGEVQVQTNCFPSTCKFVVNDR